VKYHQSTTTSSSVVWKSFPVTTSRSITRQ